MARRSRKNDAAKATRAERTPESDKVARRRTLRDLPGYTQQQDERATNPVIVLEPRATAVPRATTLPPPAAEEHGGEVSLVHLAQQVRRSAPPPPPVVHQLVVPARRPSAPTLPVQRVQPSSVPAPAVSASVPAPSRPSSPSERLRASSTVILSAGVGAIVALGMWNLSRGFESASRPSDPRPVVAAPAGSSDERCAPTNTASAPLAAKGDAPAGKAASTSESPETRPVTLDALPVAQDFPAVSRSRSASRAAPTVHSSVTTTSSETSSSESTAQPAAPAPRRAAAKSPRASVTQAVQRAASAARSCESGPQSGRIEVTFAPSGAAQSVALLQGYGDVGVNGCVLRAFGRARVPAFEGEPIVVRKTVSW